MFNLKKEGTKVEIELSVDNQEWENGVQKVYEQSKGKFNCVGFRKGHAPRKVIEKQYGDSVFFEDTIEYFVNKTLNEVLVNNPELEPVDMPTTQFESFTLSEGLKMKILFEIVPNFELCKYKGVDIKVAKHEATEKDVEHSIHHFLENHVKFETVDREVKSGDIAVIDFEGFVDKVSFDGGKAEDYSLEIGSHSFIDNFEDQIVGHKKGDSFVVNVKFPENYGMDSLNGKAAEFNVTVKEVKEKIVPELTDKLVSDTTEFETVEEYKNHELAHIQDMYAKQFEEEFKYQARKYLVENTKIDLPESMIERNVQQDLERMKQTLEVYGMTVEQYLTMYRGASMEEYLKEARVRTEEMIKSRYVFRKLIEENNLKVDAAVLAERTKSMTDEEQVLSVENELLLEEIYKFLRENNNIVEVKE